MAKRKTKKQKEDEAQLKFFAMIGVLCGVYYVVENFFIWYNEQVSDITVEVYDTVGGDLSNMKTINDIIWWFPFFAIVLFIIDHMFFKPIRKKNAYRKLVANTPELQKLDRMFVYVWEDLNTPGEVKFGEHFEDYTTLKTGIYNTRKYIRSSLGRQKYKYDRGDIKVWAVMDASVYAKENGRFRKNSKIDDVIRKKVLTRRIGRSEFHKMNGEIVVNKVKNVIGYL